MIIIVDERAAVTKAYCSSLMREGIATTGFSDIEFEEWFQSADKKDISAIEAIIVGTFPNRISTIAHIKSKSSLPIIAVNDLADLDSMINLFAAGADDVVRKPVHAREFVARIGAIKRRVCDTPEHTTIGQLRVYFDGRDPEACGRVLMMPRRERRILEYLAGNRTRRVNRAMIFNAVYGLFKLRNAMAENKSRLSVHFAAAKEITDSILEVMRDNDSDGTYLGWSVGGSARQ